jgi:RND family efflux transporter MFP subunit
VEVDIVPEVPGKVVSMHPELKVGGFIRAGETILQIDKRDYELAVEQSRAAVAQAQVALDMEKAEADVAKREWRQLHPDSEPDSPLVLREPQIKQAEATLESANAQLATAKLKLERTEVSLPLDILIISENVDLGQYVNVGQSLGSGYGVEAVEIEVPLEDKELAWFDVFGSAVSVNGNGASERRTAATVKARFAGAEHTWQGYVTRTTGQADRTSRMVSVVVEVANPFEGPSGKPPLLPGVFADVIIEGRTLKDAVAVPRDAIRGGNQIWAVNDGRLHIRSLDIVRADKDYAYAVSGLGDKAEVIISSLDAAVDGMDVRTAEDAAVARSADEDANQPSGSEAR